MGAFLEFGFREENSTNICHETDRNANTIPSAKLGLATKRRWMNAIWGSRQENLHYLHATGSNSGMMDPRSLLYSHAFPPFRILTGEDFPADFVAGGRLLGELYAELSKHRLHLAIADVFDGCHFC